MIQQHNVFSRYSGIMLLCSILCPRVGVFLLHILEIKKIAGVLWLTCFKKVNTKTLAYICAQHKYLPIFATKSLNLKKYERMREENQQLYKVTFVV